jgi:hypothetical protein
MRLLALLFATLLLTGASFPADSGFFGGGILPGFFGSPQGSAAPPFSGVIDQEPTINHFFGLMAGSLALATAQVKAVDLCDSGVSCAVGATSCIGVKVLATGQLDINSGLYCNSGTSTVSSWCSLLATCVVGGTARVVTLYDQLNQGLTAVGSGYAASPSFILSGVNAQPTMLCVSANTSVLGVVITTISLPFTVGATFERTANFTTPGDYVITSNDANITGTSSANTVGADLDGNGQITATAADGTGTTDFSHFHNAAAAYGAGGTVLYVDGAGTSGAVTFAASTGTLVTFCATASTNFADAYWRRAWTDPTQISTAVGNAVTNSSNTGF